MLFNSNIRIPGPLLDRSEFGDDINILIGENGSGKSTVLNEVAKYYLASQRYKVIAVANTIHDKFNIRDNRFEILRASTGKTIAKKTLKRALKLLSSDDNKRINNIGAALKYVNLDPVIGLQVKGINKDYRYIIEEAELDSKIKKDLIFCLSRFVEESQYGDDIQRINLHHGNFYDLRDSFLISILLYEEQLRRLKIVKKIEVYLCKERQMLPVNSASSGELTMITSLLYLTISIDTRSIVLIDEPENSLHPKWQTEYVKLLVDHFHRYEPKIIIATHSPLIINAAEITSQGVRVFKGSNGLFTDQHNDTQNVEEMYQDYFDVTTPENRFLSEKIVKEMNQLAAGMMNLEEFEHSINDFKDSSYSDQQKEALDGIIEMGRKIKERQ
ncbi:ATP-binding protein [Pedobacter sp. P351]|uniref:AAA family ATPase n=1 Tax=Pedobacter superstes TaxID=3133441 RepID=UPI0030A0D181